ncbi:hypothetical protein GC174_17745 [bacterium]|nr:hypothetical protein [bacterium]
MANRADTDAGDLKFDGGDNGEKAAPQAFTLAEARVDDVLKTAGATADVQAVAGTLEITADRSEYPPTKQEQLQEFVDGFGKVGKLYDDAVKDPARFAKFQERMGAVYQDDHETFMDLADVGKEMTDNPPSSPEKVGQDLAFTLANAIDRKLQTGSIDPGSEDMQNLMGAVAGMMLAARSNFDPGAMGEQTRTMVDSFDTALQTRIPVIRGIIWGDNGEPGIAVVPPGESIDRHKYLP